MSAWMARRAAAALVVAVALVALPACERQVSGPSLVLRLASPRAGDPGHGPAHTSGSRPRWTDDREAPIRIEPVWDVAVAGTTGFDQFTAGKVVDGTYKLGLVPSRAWDELGVESLRALNAPFLLTSHAALASVLSGSLRAQLMAGLSDAGVVGLDLFPDALRHPFGFDEPLLGSEDYAGAVIWAPVSDTVTRLFRGLGAEVTDSETSTLRGGAEAQFSLAPAGVTYGTGNVTFYPKTNVLVAGADLPARLGADPWSVLTDAAAATREWQITRPPCDFVAAAGFCERAARSSRQVTTSWRPCRRRRPTSQPGYAKIRRPGG